MYQCSQKRIQVTKKEKEKLQNKSYKLREKKKIDKKTDE